MRAAVILPWSRSERASDGLRSADHRLAEAVGLTSSIGLVVVHTAILPLRVVRPSTLLGEGQVAAQAGMIRQQGVTVAVVDGALSPVHVSVEQDHAAYIEPNLWIHHRLSP